MNELTKQITDRLRPMAALIAYKTAERNNYFLELRKIDDSGRFSEGRPVTVDFMNELIQIPNVTAPLLTAVSPKICYIVTAARVARGIYGIISPANA